MTQTPCFPRPQFRCLRTAALLSLLTLSFPLGCSKSPEQGGGDSTSATRALEISPVRENPLLTYLPSSALGFYLIDFSLESAKKYSASPWSGSGAPVSENIKKLANAEQGETKEALMLLEELEGAGLIPSPNAKGKLNAFMATFGVEERPGSEPLPVVAVYENFAGQDNTAVSLAELQKKLETKGMKTKPFAVEGGSGFSADFALGKEESKKVKTSFIFAAKGPRLIATNSSAMVDVQFLNVEASKSTRFTEIKNDPQYQRAQAAIPAHKDEFSVSYLDTKRLLAVASRVSPEVKAAQADIEKLPVGSAFMAREMDLALVDRGSMLLVSDAAKPNLGVEEIRKVSPKAFNSQLPAGLVGFVSVDGAIVKALVKSMAESEQTAELKPILDKALSIEELGLALRPQQGASPLPEIVLILESSSASELASMISGSISSGTNGQGFLSPFQKKDIQGVSVEYALSPFGAGVFVAATANQVLVSTSETILSELIAGAKENKGLALDGLTAESKALLTGKDSLALVHVDYSKVSSLIQGLSASLGIFTGGKPLVEEEELKRISSYGQTSASINVVEDSIRFVTRTEPSTATKK